MTSNFLKVEEFHKAFGQDVLYSAQFPSQNVQELRVALIEEELKELKQAINEKDIVQVADALTDLLYVVYGAGHAFGIDLDETFDEVHRSNMSKLGSDGKPIYRDDGKVLKGPNYFEPNLANLLTLLAGRPV